VKLVLASVVHPKSLPSCADFLASIAAQTDEHFETLLLLDGVTLDALAPPTDSRRTCFSAQGSPPFLRKQLLRRCADLGADGVILLDSDDTMKANRVATCRSFLESGTPLLFNDLAHFHGEFAEAKATPWLSAVISAPSMGLADLAEQNCLGLSNMAFLMREMPQSIFGISEKMSAFDWAFAVRFLLGLGPGGVATFVRSTCTYYRQHDENMADIGVEEGALARCLEIKLAHYRDLVGLWPPAVEMARQAEELLQLRFTGDRAWAEYVRWAQGRFNPRGLWWSQAPLRTDQT
jgi:hypothetical protein